jgi:malate synthase
MEFVAALHDKFFERREELLVARQARQEAMDEGLQLDFLPETASVRESDWSIARLPDALQDRRVEITGPCDRKMMINALNSGAKMFMADCEDAQSPSWNNQVAGQVNLFDAVREQIAFSQPDGKEYKLNDGEIACLLVRPRGWHLPEKHVLYKGKPMSGSLFDFGLYFFHNAKAALERGRGPFFYLPKLEHYLEARLWNDVFTFAEETLGVPQGSCKATVLIETIHAAYQMDEIIYELRDHMAGLNAGRWDYIFSCIKTHRTREVMFPDRSQVTMTVPFMFAYTELLVKTCHRRSAHAIGGMAAFIPNRRDPEATEKALAKVAEDKKREANQGYDGSWVAHPGLVPVCREQFDAVLGDKPHQKDVLREDVNVSAEELRDFRVPEGKVTEDGLRMNISVGILYLNSWLLGNGAAAINNLMEDAATAEISRSQLWQWIHKGAKLDDGRTVTKELYAQLRDEELDKIGRDQGRVAEAAKLIDAMVESEAFPEFLTLPAYEQLD